MKRAALCLAVLFLTTSAIAGFKVKLVKPKKPEKYDVFLTLSGVTYAADLLLKGKEQKDFFYKELSESNVIALRLAVFNRGSEEIRVPLEDLKLTAPDGAEVVPVAPDAVSEAVLRGLVVLAGGGQTNPAVVVSPSSRPMDPRADPSDPRYDPRYDPTRPGRTADPRMDPSDPRYDPRYDPADPRSRRDPYGRGPWMRPGVDVVLSPGGGSVGDLSEFERSLVEKDFRDKAHSEEPVLPSFTRDKFIYFSLPDPPSSARGFELWLPAGNGISKEVVLKF